MRSAEAAIEPFLSPDQLLQLLRQTFGARVEIIESTIGNQHPDYLVLLIKLRHPSLEVVVKLAGPKAPLHCPFDRTAMLHHLVTARTTIPMPEVIAVDVTYQTWPWRYFIKTHIPGLEWAVAREQMSPEQRSDAHRQIGDAVGQLHAIHFPGFGELAVDGSIQKGASFYEALIERSRLFIKSERMRELFYSVVEKREQLFNTIRTASLCHEDLHWHNVLFHYNEGYWRLATILDFDKAWAGYHETDLARLELWKSMVADEFWLAYKAHCSINPLYEQRRPIYQFLWCLEFARLTEKHLADTRHLCQELGLPPLDSFD